MAHTNGRILCIEDDSVIACLIQTLLEREGFQTALAGSGKAAFEALAAEPPDLCLLDLQLPDGSGLDFLPRLRTQVPAMPVIVVTASESHEDVLAAMKGGAVDYINKPVDHQRLLVSVRNALASADQGRQIVQLRRDVEEGRALVGTSPAMERLRVMIRKTAASEATILIQGESGTGKELVARALHHGSRRASGPFVDINSAGLAESLLESELFGHEKGAFTGALARKKGKFEQAHGGTLLLDEIGDMPLSMQAKILRALEERAFQRVGGSDRIGVEVRVISSTHRNLQDAVSRGAFRDDLFYRINMVVLEVPPLRERISDVPELARHFLARAGREEQRDVREISTGALEALCRHAWPGNVRELRNAVGRAVVVCEGPEILPEHLPASVTGLAARPAPANASSHLTEAVERLERGMIVAALEKHGGVKSRAARELGISERQISYKMLQLGITPPAPRG